MPEQATLQAKRREILGKHVRRLRREGILPANIYGHNINPLPIQLDAHEFERFVAKHPSTTLIKLQLGGNDGEQTAIIRSMQHEPQTRAIQHVDFLHVEMSEPIRAAIPIHLIGEAPATRTADGILLHLLDAVEVEALPGDLPTALELDVSGMTELNATVHVSDLTLPSGVTVLTESDEPIAKIEPPRISVEEVVAAPEAPETPAPTGEATP